MAEDIKEVKEMISKSEKQDGKIDSQQNNKTADRKKANKKSFRRGPSRAHWEDSNDSRKTNSTLSFKKLNSPNFYGAGTPLTDKACDLSTAFVQGSDIKKMLPIDGSEGGLVFSDNSHRFANGRILGIKTQFLVPDSDSGYKLTDVFPKTAWAMWNALRGTKTSTVPFDPQDLQCYIITLANIICYANHINRRLKAISVSFNSNKYWPYVLNGVLGQCEGSNSSSTYTFSTPSVGTNTLFTSYENELKALAQNQMDLSESLLQLVATPAPKGIPLLERARTIFSYIYSDDVNFTGANYYCLVPSGVYAYDPTLPGLRFVNVTGAFRYIRDEITILREMIRNFTFDSDMATIGAWIRDNLGIDSTPVLNPAPITAGFGCSEMLEAIANSHTHPMVSTNVVKSATGQTWANTGCLLDFNAATEATKSLVALCMNQSMWLHSYHPLSKDDILMNTRFKPVYTITSGEGTAHPIFSLQSDFFIFNHFTMYLLSGVDKNADVATVVNTWSFTSTGRTPAGAKIAGVISAIEFLLIGFEYHPDIVTLDTTVAEAGTTITTGERLTYDNHFMHLEASRLPLLHQAAIYGELGIYSAFVRTYSKIE